MFYDLDADASSTDGGPGGRLKSNRKRITGPAELRALRDNLLPDDLESAKAIVTAHVEQNDTIMLCFICRNPSKITTCYDCGTADLCALCMFDHGCLQPVCGHCGGRNLDSDTDKSTCNACGRRDLCVRCRSAHNCQAIAAEVAQRRPDNMDHLDGVDNPLSEGIMTLWTMFHEGETVEFPKCPRCREYMSIDDINHVMCKNCRFDKAEEAGLTETSKQVIASLEHLNRTDLFAGTKHETYCVCCCVSRRIQALW